MWKEEIDEEIGQQLNQFTVDIPHHKLSLKQSKWQRFIRYLGRPAKDPLEEVTETFIGLEVVKVAPSLVALFIMLVNILFISIF